MRAAWAVVGAVVLLGATRVGVAPAEQCPTVSVADARAAVEGAIGWLGDGQAADGMFTYSNVLPGYNVVRHAGVLLSLEQASTAGFAAAEPVAERGREWALDRLVPAGDGLALPELTGEGRTGASALFARSLLELRSRSGTTEHDDVLRDLGRFLAGQVLVDGAVSSRWDPATDAAIPSQRDIFFTGQVLWALDGIDLVGLADDDVREATARVGAFLPRRDHVEDRFPPVSDHWGAYAYDGLGLARLTPTQLAHAERLVGIIGVQVRGESTRWRGGVVGDLRGDIASGSGLGTLGEGGLALLRLFGNERADGLSTRMRCVAGMIVERQDDDGAWYRDGVTRMDDQQHSMSALLASMPLLEDPGDVVGGGEEPHTALWLLLAGAVGALPFRPPRPRPVVVVAGAVGAAVLVALSGPVLEGLEVSPASARAAAGVAVGIAALAVLAAPAAAATTGVATAAAGVLALAVGADDGAAALLAVAVAGALAMFVPEAWRNGVTSRIIAVVALFLAADLVIDGVLGV